METESIVAAVPAPSTPRKPSRIKQVIFIITASLGIPIILFLGLEFELRASGYGYTTTFFIKKEIDRKPVFVNNPEFGLRFFPKPLLRKSDPLVVPSVKDDRTIRIFILGSSAALGDPNPSFGFGRILEKMLQARYPQRQFEVVNAAMTAINSHVVAPIARECLQRQPDLLILYMGNNEVIGPFGAASVISPYSSNLFFIRSRLTLLTWKTGQWLQNLLGRTTPSSNQLQQWKGMEMLSEKNYVRWNDPHLNNVHNHFLANLQTICSQSGAAQVPILVCTVGTNLKDFPPLASLHDPQLKNESLDDWKTLYQKGIDEETASRFAEALGAYRQAEKIDAHFADLHYRMGRCALQTGNAPQAKEYFVRAREEDALRFRADTEINKLIRNAASQKEKSGIYLADVEKTLEDRSRNQIPGDEFFHEHVHLNFSGNYQVARSLIDAVERALAQKMQPETAAGSILEEKEVKERLAYTLWDRYQSLKNIIARISVYPFTQQIGHDERLQKMKAEAASMEKIMTLQLIHQHKGQYQQAIELSPHDWQIHYHFGRLLMAAQCQIEAVTQFQLVAQSIPHHPGAFFDLGVAYLESGDYPNALARFQQTLAMQPDYRDAEYNIAITLSKQNKTNEAIQKYREILQKDPSYENAYYQLGSIYFQKQEWDFAEQNFTKVIELNPQSMDAYISLGLIQGKRGDYQKALEIFERALKYHPDDPTIQRYVRAAQKKLN